MNKSGLNNDGTKNFGKKISCPYCKKKFFDFHRNVKECTICNAKLDIEHKKNKHEDQIEQTNNNEENEFFDIEQFFQTNLQYEQEIEQEYESFFMKKSMDNNESKTEATSYFQEDFSVFYDDEDTFI